MEPSWPTRDGPCPQCGHLLWFAESSASATQEARSAFLRMGEMRFGLAPPELKEAISALVERPDRERVFERLLTASSWAELLAEH